MKNLFKKTLACCLAVCMVLTLCIGAMTANAEAVTGTVTVGTADITTADKAATVDVTVDANPLAAAEVVVNVPAGLTIAGLAFTADDSVEITYAPAANPTGKPVALSEATEFVAPDVVDGKFTYIIHLPANTTTANAVVLSITFAGTFAEGKIDVAVASAEACYDAESDLIALTFVPGAINVTAAHVCAVARYEKEDVVDATCTDDGSYVNVGYCDCGEEVSRETITVDALGHTEETIPAVDATCTTAGATAGVKCSVCDTVLTAPTTVDALGHAWVDGDITYTDCTSNGNLAQACSRCDATQTVAVDPKGHTPVAYDEVPATCTTVGYTGGKYCSAEGCGAVIEARTEIPATGHKEVYTNNGDNHTVTCSNGCDMSVTEDHSFVDGECVCGAVEKVACEHANITYVSHVAPLEGGKGSITYTCTDCEETFTEEVLYDNTFKFDSAAASYEAETILIFGFSTTAANWKGVDQDKSFAILTKANNDDDGDGTPEVKVQYISELTEDGTKTSRISMTYPLAAAELNDNVARQIIVYKDGKWYSRKVGNYSFVQYAAATLPSADATLKTLLIDLLNYGTVAQNRFGYNTANPANTADASFANYSGSTNALTLENKLETENKRDRYRFNGIAASFESRAELNFNITDINRNNITDTSLVYVTVAYTDAYGVEQVKRINGDEFRVLSSGKVYADFAELYATQMRQVVTVTLYAADNDAVQYIAKYSLESYAAQNTTTAEATITEACIRFGDSANAHFNK